MRSPPCIAIGLVLAVSLVACGSPTLTKPPKPSARPPASANSTLAGTLATRLDEALESVFRDSGAPGAQAAIVFADGAVWAGAAGSSTGDLPMKPELLMAIGSVTKVYTATLILDLVDDGVLELDDPLMRWVPDSVNAEGVTIRQLLLHSSGIASDDPAQTPVCEPGECQSYSNSGYRYLGEVIERATGGAYAAALHDRILNPLGLDSTFFPGQEAVDGEAAMGHLGAEEALADDAATSAGSGPRGAAGGIVATAADTAQFADALFGGRLLSPTALDAVLDFEATRGLPGASDCTAEAMVYRRGGSFGESWNHGGNTGYFRSWVEHYPRHGLTIVVNVNSDLAPVGFVDRLAGEAVADSAPGGAAADGGGECDTDVAIIEPDGSVRALTSTRGFDGMPSWSPDGKALAWIADREGRSDIYVADADGGNPRRLTDDAAHDALPRWSPDGSWIAFSSNRDGDHEIYLVTPDGTDVRQLTRNEVDDFVGNWSPDGGQLAYVSGSGERLIRIINVDGESDHPVSGAVDEPWWPTWSPDGQRIAYESRGVIFIIPTDGGEPVRLPIQQIRVTRFPTWAPGSDIAFSSDGDLYAVAADGSDLRRLSATSTTELGPVWSRDGASLAFELEHWVTSP